MEELLDHFLDYCDELRQTQEANSDMTDGNIGFFRLYLGRKITYPEYLGFWFNRTRAMCRRAEAMALGAGIGFGTLVPSIEYYRAISDGEGEALMKKAMADANRDARRTPPNG